MKKFLACITTLLICNVSWAAPSESYCLKIGKMTETVARLREQGVTEESLREMRVERASKDRKVKSKEEIQLEEENEFAMENLASYVFTVKLDSENARLVGFKKCLAGDFTQR